VHEKKYDILCRISWYHSGGYVSSSRTYRLHLQGRIYPSKIPSRNQAASSAFTSSSETSALSNGLRGVISQKDSTVYDIL
jgi:hypothetical protein